MAIKKHLGTISILIKDRRTHVTEVQRVLTDNGHLIMARLGINIERKCSTNCTGLITIVVEGTSQEINGLTKKLDKLYGIVAKANILAK